MGFKVIRANCCPKGLDSSAPSYAPAQAVTQILLKKQHLVCFFFGLFVAIQLEAANLTCVSRNSLTDCWESRKWIALRSGWN